MILYPGIAGRSAGNRRCQVSYCTQQPAHLAAFALTPKPHFAQQQTDDNGVFANSYHLNNVCASADGQFYSFSDCKTNNLNTTVYVTKNNTLYADAGSNFSQSCGVALDFAAWQSLNQDVGSTTAVTPSVSELIALGAAKVLPGM